MRVLRGIYIVARALVLALAVTIAGALRVALAVFRQLVGPLGLLVLAALAVVGLALAIFEIQGDRATLSLAHLASLIHLPDARRGVGVYLRHLETNTGPIGISIGAGIGAIATGLLLAAAVLIPARERRLTLVDGERGRITARRGTLAQAATVLVEQADDVGSAQVRARPYRRRAGGRLRIAVRRRPGSDRRAVEQEVTRRLAALAERYGLATRVRARAVAKEQLR